MNPHTITVTGSSGSLGVNLVDYLLGIGKYVHGVDMVDRVNVRSQSYLPVIHNLLDTPALDIRSSHGMIHLAGGFSSTAHSGDVEQGKQIVQYIRGLMEAALHTCHDNEIPVLINASSISVYGESTDYPFKEVGNCYPMNPYAEGKLRAEDLALAKATSLGVRVFSIRLCNVIGKAQNQHSLPWKALEAATHEGPTVMLYGVNYRSWTWIDDMCRFFAYILHHYDKFDPGHYVFNFGTTESSTQLGLFREIEKQTDWVVPWRLAKTRSTDMVRATPDMSLVESLFGSNFQSKDAFSKGIADVIATYLYLNPQYSSRE